MRPNCLDQWFSLEQQRFYVSKLLGRVGLTRRRAECFVRLWAYLLLKQQILKKQLNQPLVQLTPMQMPVACTHREAAELFYVNQESRLVAISYLQHLIELATAKAF